MDDLATVEVVRTEGEAELLCSILKGAGIICMHRLSNRGAGAFEGLAAGGPHEIVVRSEDLASARGVLDAQANPS